MTPDLAPFFAAIDAAPEDSLRVGLLADYLEERGHEWGPPMRWAYVHGKRPELFCGRWWWWLHLNPVHANIYGIPGYQHNSDHGSPYHDSAAAAFRWLCESCVEAGGLEAVAC